MIADHDPAEAGFEPAPETGIVRIQLLIDPDLPMRPLIGINGEAYLRANKFSNKDLARVCEEAGTGSRVISCHRMDKIHIIQKVGRCHQESKSFEIVKSFISKSIQEHDENSIANCFGDRVGEKRLQLQSYWQNQAVIFLRDVGARQY